MSVLNNVIKSFESTLYIIRECGEMELSLQRGGGEGVTNRQYKLK